MKIPEGFAALITAVLGIITAIPALHSWIAMRKRAKLKADIELLKALRDATRVAKTEPRKEDGAALPAETPDTKRVAVEGDLTDGDVFIASATKHLCEKIDHKMRSFKESDDRYKDDTDWSKIFAGLSLLFIAGVSCHYWYLHKAVTKGLNMIEWQYELLVLLLALVLTGFLYIGLAFRRWTPRLRKFFHVDKKADPPKSETDAKTGDTATDHSH